MDLSHHGRSSHHITDLELSIRRYPFQSLGIGFLTGFVMGGGQNSRIGQGLIGFAARIAVRQAVMTALSEALKKS